MLTRWRLTRRRIGHSRNLLRLVFDGAHVRALEPHPRGWTVNRWVVSCRSLNEWRLLRYVEHGDGDLVLTERGRRIARQKIHRP